MLLKTTGPEYISKLGGIQLLSIVLFSLSHEVFFKTHMAYDQKEIKLEDRESIIPCGNFKRTGANNQKSYPRKQTKPWWDEDCKSTYKMKRKAFHIFKRYPTTGQSYRL